MREIKISGRAVGPEHPPYVIAEACINHEGDVRIAREMVLHARAAGADAIKFQLHVLDDEMLRQAPQSANFDEPLYDTLARTNLSIEEHLELKGALRKYWYSLHLHAVLLRLSRPVGASNRGGCLQSRFRRVHQPPAADAYCCQREADDRLYRDDRIGRGRRDRPGY